MTIELTPASRNGHRRTKGTSPELKGPELGGKFGIEAIMKFDMNMKFERRSRRGSARDPACNSRNTLSIPFKLHRLETNHSRCAWIKEKP